MLKGSTWITTILRSAMLQLLAFGALKKKEARKALFTA
jgi:hypothetical protein